MSHYHGVLIANTRQAAQVCLDRMYGLLGVTEDVRPTWHRDWLVITPQNYRHAGRGLWLPNRVLVYDFSEGSIPDEIWHAIIPCLHREDGESLNVHYYRRATQRTDLIRDHVFTVRRQDGIGPHPPDLPCAMVVGEIGKVPPGPCGKRADEHVGVPLARGARDMLAER